MEILRNAKQMKACDARTIRLGIPSMVLMERAAMAVVEEMKNASLDLSKVLVVCGSGNNGGDGFAVARMLAHADICFAGKETSMTKETALQRRICENCGLKISSNFPEGEYTTIVDAMLGIGLSRPVEGRYAEVISWINAQAAQVVAVDIPSGISADSGRVLGTAVRADLTVTFAARKPGQILYPGAEYCGRLVCRDIGLLADGMGAFEPSGCTYAVKNRRGDLENQGEPPFYFTYTEQDLARLPKRVPDSHKGTYGKVLLIAGSEGMSGAAQLAARGAFRSGCGMVRVFTPVCNRTVIQTSIPEAMVTAWEPGGEKRKLLEEALAWSDVTGIGPGLGTSEDARELLSYVLKHYEKPVVIDADGLNLLSAQLSVRDTAADEQAETVYATDDHGKPSLRVSNLLRGKVILTPHVGEMARLAGKDKKAISADLIGAAEDFAQAHEMICALKAARTVVSDGTQVYLNTSGNDGMAVAGSGDVLTGVICGLLAQGTPVFEAATLGVYIHGLAGDLARKERGGAYGMMAGDIADSVAKVMKRADTGS
ncbi:MAG: NAD(P)H-hydrate dehydratase [Clostridiales bacterium]|nr:NAD(P)H-hydrate dehydratase [Clostridiales bacterium]